MYKGKETRDSCPESFLGLPRGPELAACFDVYFKDSLFSLALDRGQKVWFSHPPEIPEKSKGRRGCS